MKIVDFGTLPPGVEIRGVLYDEPALEHLPEDLVEVELPNRLMIDVSWDSTSPDRPYRIVVYREYFGDRFIDFNVRNVDQVVVEVRRLIDLHSAQAEVVASAGSQTESNLQHNVVGPPFHRALPRQ